MVLRVPVAYPFYYFSFLDVISFSRSLAGRQDAGFFVCGQLSRYIRRLAGRCAISSSIPKEDEWDELLSLVVTPTSQLSATAFLQKLGLDEKVTIAAKHKAEADICDTRNRDAVDKLAVKLKEDFALLGRDFVKMLLVRVSKNTSLTSELVKGLACFDPKMLFQLPLQLCTKHFLVLYRSFCSRGWVPTENEQACLDEYTTFVELMREGYSNLVESPELLHDVVDFITPLTILRERPQLRYLFQLCCLCLTSNISELPVVELGSTNSNNSNCRIREAVFMVQSFLQNVPDCLERCVSPDSISRYLTLRTDFGVGGFTNVYSPWNSVDFCNYSGLYNSFRQVYQGILQRRSEAPSTSAGPGGSPQKAALKASVASAPVVSAKKTVAIDEQSTSGKN